MARALARDTQHRSLWLASIPSPLGLLEAAACEAGVCELSFPREREREAELDAQLSLAQRERAERHKR